MLALTRLFTSTRKNLLLIIFLVFRRLFLGLAARFQKKAKKKKKTKKKIAFSIGDKSVFHKEKTNQEGTQQIDYRLKGVRAKSQGYCVLSIYLSIYLYLFRSKKFDETKSV
jgi:hypothetical protein